MVVMFGQFLNVMPVFIGPWFVKGSEGACIILILALLFNFPGWKTECIWKEPGG
jgi:hypothetical protein